MLLGLWKHHTKVCLHLHEAFFPPSVLYPDFPLFKKIFLYLFAVFLTAPSLPCFAGVFSRCGGRGALLFTVVTSLAAEHRLYSTGSVVVVPLLNDFVVCEIFPEQASPPVPIPALAGRFLFTAPPGKSFHSLTFHSFNTCVLEKVFCIETFMCSIIPL